MLRFQFSTLSFIIIFVLSLFFYVDFFNQPERGNLWRLLIPFMAMIANYILLLMVACSESSEDGRVYTHAEKLDRLFQKDWEKRQKNFKELSELKWHI